MKQKLLRERLERLNSEDELKKCAAILREMTAYLQSLEAADASAMKEMEEVRTARAARDADPPRPARRHHSRGRRISDAHRSCTPLRRWRPS